jgi:hypothetical protein
VTQTAKVKVHKGTQVVHDGKVYDNEETVDVPDEVGQFWVRSGWCSEMKARTQHK